MKERLTHSTKVLSSSSRHPFDTLPSCLHCYPNILPNTFHCYLLYPTVPMSFPSSPCHSCCPLDVWHVSIIPECGSHHSQDYVHHSWMWFPSFPGLRPSFTYYSFTCVNHWLPTIPWSCRHAPEHGWDIPEPNIPFSNLKVIRDVLEILRTSPPQKKRKRKRCWQHW